MCLKTAPGFAMLELFPVNLLSSLNICFTQYQLTGRPDIKGVHCLAECCWRIGVKCRMYDFQFSYENGSNFSPINNARKYCILMYRWFTILSGLDEFWISSIWVANSQLKVEETVFFLNFTIPQWRALSNNFMFTFKWLQPDPRIAQSVRVPV